MKSSTSAKIFQNFNDIKFPFLGGYFPALASFRYSGELKILFTKKQGGECHVQIIGPFLFATQQTSEETTFIFLPDYYIRSHPNTNCIELIPKNPTLFEKFYFWPKEKELIQEWVANMKKAISTIYTLPASLPDLQFESFLVDTHNSTMQNIYYIIGNTSNCVILESPVTQIRIPYSFDFHISSSCEVDIIPPDKRVFTITLYENLSQPHYVFFNKGIDIFLCAYLATATPLLKIRRMTITKPNNVSCFASPFPILTHRMIWNLPLPFFNEPSTLTSNITIEITDKIEFDSSACKVPSTASDNLFILNFNDHQIKKRTILIPSAHPHHRQFYQHLQHTKSIVSNNKFEQNDTNFELEIEKLRNESKAGSFELKLEDDKTIFNFAENTDKDYFNTSGQMLLNEYFMPPNPSNIYSKQEKVLGLNLNTDRKILSNERILDELTKTINNLPSIVHCDSKEFNTICSLISSSLIIATDQIQIIQQLTKLCNNDSKLTSCIPVGKSNLSESIFTFVSRLIISHRITRFFELFLKSPEWRRNVYSKSSSVYIVNFFTSLSFLLPKLNDITFFGNFNPNNCELIYDIFAERIDLAIKDDIMNILRIFRYNKINNELNDLIFHLLYDLTCFFKNGFNQTTNNVSLDCWNFFILATKLKLNIPEFNVFKYIVEKVNKQKNKIVQLLVPQCLLMGMKTGSIPMWILILAKAAMEYKTHSKDALIYYRDPVMIVAESLKLLESFKIETDPDYLIQCLHIF